MQISLEKYRRNYVELLKSKVCVVRFEKKDGTTRIMRCTLQDSYLPEKTANMNELKKMENLETIAVFDLDKNAWRSFRVDSIQQFTIEQ